MQFDPSSQISTKQSISVLVTWIVTLHTTGIFRFKQVFVENKKVPKRSNCEGQEEAASWEHLEAGSTGTIHDCTGR